MIGTIHPGIFTCIGICMVMLVGVMGRETIFRLFKRAMIGICAIMVINLLMPEMMNVGINWMTIGCTSLLGAPGIVMLYVIKLII